MAVDEEWAILAVRLVQFISSVRLFFVHFLQKIKRSTGTQRNNQKVWPFAFFPSPFFHSILARSPPKSLSFQFMAVHIERRTTCCDGQYFLASGSIVRNANIRSLSIFFSRLRVSFRFFFFNFIRDINRRNIRRKTFKRNQIAKKETKEKKSTKTKFDKKENVMVSETQAPLGMRRMCHCVRCARLCSSVLLVRLPLCCPQNR